MSLPAPEDQITMPQLASMYQVERRAIYRYTTNGLQNKSGVSVVLPTWRVPGKQKVTTEEALKKWEADLQL